MNNDQLTITYTNELDTEADFYFQIFRKKVGGWGIKNFLDGVKFKTVKEANEWIYKNYPYEEDHLFLSIMKVPNHVSEYWHYQFTTSFGSDEFYKHNIDNGINEVINWTKQKQRDQFIKEEEQA